MPIGYSHLMDPTWPSVHPWLRPLVGAVAIFLRSVVFLVFIAVSTPTTQVPDRRPPSRFTPIPCVDSTDCGGGLCVDGYCCNQRCAEPCQGCNVNGLEGLCRPRLAGELEPSCSPYLCDGHTTGCPGTCYDDDDCFAGFICNNEDHCVPPFVIGEPCIGANQCASGHCVFNEGQGVCCHEACEGGCGRCNVPGSLGYCLPQSAGWATTECAPYLCNGSELSCPTFCTRDDDCLQGNVCDEKSKCVRQDFQFPGTPCSRDDQCHMSQCVDGTCCQQPDCTPYRCSPVVGDCYSFCKNNEDCARGFICNSESECVTQPPVPDDAWGSCAMGAKPSWSRRELQWPLIMLALCLWRRRTSLVT